MDYNMLVNVLLIALAAWFIFSRFAGVPGLRNVQPEQLQEELANDRGAVLIDVREPSEFSQGRIPGAVSIPLSQLSRRINEIPREQNVYLYCRSGMRSKQAARVLRKNGFRQLAHLQGGILSWRGKIVK